MPKRSRLAPDAATATDSRVILIVEEQTVILKRKTLTEGMRIRTVMREVEGPVPVRQEGDPTIVALLEGVVVVEKRLRATEGPAARASREPRCWRDVAFRSFAFVAAV